MLEEERKYEVDAAFGLPDLTDCVPDGGRARSLRPPQTLRATYYDTADLRLARAGASLRFRRGDDEPWTVKLPTDAPGRPQRDLHAPAAPARRRTELLELVTAYTRGAPLAPGRPWCARCAGRTSCATATDRVLAEVVDDTVTRARRPPGRADSSARSRWSARRARRSCWTGSRRRCATPGAAAGEFTPKHVRALGAGRRRPPDWPAAGRACPTQPDAPGTWSPPRSARDIARIVAHDPLVRLRAPVGDDDTAVHQMRVGCRRLRSDLRTFGAAAGPRLGRRAARRAGLAGRRARRAPATPRCCASGCAAPPRPTRWRRWTRRRSPASTPTWPPGTRTRSQALDKAMRTDALPPRCSTRCVDAATRAAARPTRGRRAGRRGAAAAGRPAVAAARRTAATASTAPAELDPAAPDDALARGAHQRQAGPVRGRGGAPRCSAARRPCWPRRWPRCRTCSASTRTRRSRPTPGSAIADADPDDHVLAVTAGPALRAGAGRGPRGARGASRRRGGRGRAADATAWLP